MPSSPPLASNGHTLRVKDSPSATAEWRAALLSLVHTLFEEPRRGKQVAPSTISRLCEAITEVDVRVLRDFVSELVTEIVKRQLALEPGRAGGDAAQMGSSPCQTIVDEVRRTIDTRFAERLTVRSLAERLDTPAAPLAIAFRQRFGLTIHGYLTQVRVAQGIGMIRAGAKVEAAARLVGYRSRKDFYAAVSKSTGLTLSQIRPSRPSEGPASRRA